MHFRSVIWWKFQCDLSELTFEEINETRGKLETLGLFRKCLENKFFPGEEIILGIVIKKLQLFRDFY